MGQQHYEQSIQRALLDLPESGGWDFNAITVTGARGGIRGARRTLSRLHEEAPLPLALALGSALYRTRDLVHRFDLRLPPSPGPEVVTAHDLPPARFADEGLLPRSIAAATRRARAVIVPSEFAAMELRELLGVRRTHVIPYGLSEDYFKPVPASDETLRELGIGAPFALHAAGASARKNLPNLARAWAQVTVQEPQLQLVLCGPPDGRRNRAFAGLPNVVMPGRVPTAVIAALMCRSELVVVPSLYEGFGLPALEGMACGSAVVAARRGALPEVCLGAAILVEPDADGLAGGMLSALRDDELRAHLGAAGRQRAGEFSWERAARSHLEVYRTVL